MRCRLHNDKWEDWGIEYTVHSYKRTDNSTAVVLELESHDGTRITKVVASHQIEWIDNES